DVAIGEGVNRYVLSTVKENLQNGFLLEEDTGGRNQGTFSGPEINGPFEMETLKPPEGLKLVGNVDGNWRSFKQHFELYMSATGMDNKPEPRKIAMLLTVAGPQAIEVFNTFEFDTADDKEKYSKVIEKFEAYCSPKKNIVYERYVFRSRMQQAGETFDCFVTDLKLKAQSCDFGTLKDSMVRDQIVYGIHDKRTRERMLRDDKLTLEEAEKICRANELAQQHAKTFADTSASVVHESAKVAVVRNKMKRNDQQKTNKDTAGCKRCGGKHEPRQCPAYGKRCAKCNGKNHFAKQCLTKERSKPVRIVEETDLSETFFVGMVSCENAKNGQGTEAHERHAEEDNWIVSLPINGALVALRIDTGAQANLISMTEIRAMKEKPKIFKKSVQLKDYNGKEIESKGQCKLRVNVKNKEYNVLFSIVPENRESLIGGVTSKKLNLVRRVYQISYSEAVRPHNSTVDSVVQRFPDVFKGLGCLPYTYKIQLKEDAQPVIHAPRRIPAPLRERLKNELDRMCEMDVITKVEEPTEWVNSMVCVDKKNRNKELRICMDPGDLNRNIKREHYQIPKREEIASEMAGAKYFSKLDAAQGFWQIKLDDKSSRYCTFNTPYGRYRFLRMPFGIISASEIYHRAMDNMLEGLEGVRCYIDDLVIWGSTLQEHNERLAKVLHRISHNGLKLNRAKCQFGVQEITFLGDKLSAEGIEPDDRKIKAILSMPRPADKKGVLRVMGMINFIGKFIPNLSVKTSALRELLHDSTEFKWTTRNEREWNALKATLTKFPVLAYYDPAKRQKISTDASKDGLGAVLLQEEGDSWKPVAYASRSMTKTETKYAQIEKECLGLAYGLDKFHCYVYGLPTFTVETDHRPLVSIIKKNLNEMSPRIQRLIMKLQRYDFELIYTPGKHLVLADALSRAPVIDEVSSTEKEIDNHINMIVESLPVSEVKAKQISDELDKDSELQTVINNMLSGWPRGSCPKYYHFRSELSVANGLLLRDSRIVIPHSLRPEILRQIHEGHLGVEKCKRRARSAVYWPGINRDIENMVGKCDTCNKYQSKQAREPMLIPDLPTAPWEKVGTDLFHCNGKDYLLVIDYYSNFPEIALLSSTTASTVIMHMKSIFARHGIPKTVVSDNGPCYSCKEWQQFASHYGFNHVTSSPQHAQTNGKAEKGVHIIKQILKKSTDSKSDPYLALLSYRATPLECGLSPAELLMNRKLRTTLPCYTDFKHNTGIQTKLENLKWKQKQRYDKSTKPLSPLAKDDVVRIQDQDAWNRKATVLQEVGPRSYEVMTEEGHVLRRNRRSLLKTKETLSETETVSGAFSADAASNADKDGNLQMDTSNVQSELPVLRRSGRQTKRPNRLDLLMCFIHHLLILFPGFRESVGNSDQQVHTEHHVVDLDQLSVSPVTWEHQPD
ncbi:hypothetical protein NFI96_009139, partial [Prochilodus magdalenae]